MKENNFIQLIFILFFLLFFLAMHEYRSVRNTLEFYLTLQRQQNSVRPWLSTTTGYQASDLSIAPTGSWLD